MNADADICIDTDIAIWICRCVYRHRCRTRKGRAIRGGLRGAIEYILYICI